jgi:hypothetical protein
MIKSHPFCLKHIDFHVHSIVNIENDKVSLWGFKLVSSSFVVCGWCQTKLVIADAKVRFPHPTIILLSHHKPPFVFTSL